MLYRNNVRLKTQVYCTLFIKNFFTNLVYNHPIISVDSLLEDSKST